MFKAKELVDNTSPYMKTAMSGVIIDHDRLVIGTEDGLFCLDMDRTGKILIYILRVDLMRNLFYRNGPGWRG